MAVAMAVDEVMALRSLGIHDSALFVDFVTAVGGDSARAVSFEST